MIQVLRCRVSPFLGQAEPGLFAHVYKADLNASREQERGTLALGFWNCDSSFLSLPVSVGLLLPTPPTIHLIRMNKLIVLFPKKKL